MRVLLLRLDAPLMAFGGPIVDQHGVIQRFPGLAMLTGLFGNALGWDHRDGERLNALQRRLGTASRIDRPGERLTDFQTAELDGRASGWTTRGRAEGRAGGESTYDGPHLRFREFWADAVVTVAVHVQDGDSPTVDDLAAALDEPARPLFIGRKPCLPSVRLLLGIVEAPSLTVALAAAPAMTGRRGAGAGEDVPAQWPDGDPGAPARGELRLVSDRRDWVNQVHTGERRVREGTIRIAATAP